MHDDYELVIEALANYYALNLPYLRVGQLLEVSTMNNQILDLFNISNKELARKINEFSKGDIK